MMNNKSCIPLCDIKFENLWRPTCYKCNILYIATKAIANGLYALVNESEHE